MITLFWATLKRDLKLDARQGQFMLLIPSFFVLMATLYPLAIGPDKDILQIIGPGALCIAALLASLLPLSTLYRDDAQDGTLDLLTLCPHPVALYCAGKMLAHWLTCGLPIVLLSPIIAQTLFLDLPLWIIVSVLLPATFLFILIGHMIAALGVHNGSAGLMALLALPLYIPVLIFSAGALDMAQTGLLTQIKAPLSFLWSGLLASLPLAPILTAQILLMHKR